MAANLAIVITAKDMASAPMKGITGAVGGVVSALGKIGLAGMGVQALAGGVKGLGDALGVGLNASLEMVEAQLNAFTKDGAASAAILAEINKEAESTPFEFEEMARATVALMPAAKQASMPLMDLIRQAEILAASNPAEGLQGAAFSLKEALSGDFVSIVERFNLPKQRLKELKEQGVPAMEAVSLAMKDMGLDADLVANMSKTAAGRWSTFMDTLNALRVKLSKGIFKEFTAGLADLQGILDANMPTLQAWAELIGGTLARAFSTIRDLIGDIVGEGGDLGVFADSIREMTGVDLGGLVNIQRTLGGLKDAVVTLVTGGNLDEFVASFARLTGIDLGAFGPTAERLGSAVSTIGAAIMGLVPEPLMGFVAGLFRSAEAAGDGLNPVQSLAAAVNGMSAAVESALSFVREHAVVQALIVGILGAGATAYGLATAAALTHTVATRATAVATGIMTAAQTLLNAALTANPLGLVVVAVAGLGAAIGYLWSTNEDFRAAVTIAWNTIGDTAGVLGRTVGDALGAVGAAIGYLWSMNEDFRAAVMTAWNAIGDAAGVLGRAVGDALGAMGTEVGRVWDGVSGAARNAINQIIGYINALVSAWNGIRFEVPVIEIPAIELPGGGRVGGGTFGGGVFQVPGLPLIPTLDRGGIVTRPTLALLAGNRIPEAVIPLHGGRRGAASINVYVTVTGSVVAERDLAARIRESLLDMGRSNISVGLA